MDRAGGTTSLKGCFIQKPPLGCGGPRAGAHLSPGPSTAALAQDGQGLAKVEAPLPKGGVKLRGTASPWGHRPWACRGRLKEHLFRF